MEASELIGRLEAASEGSRELDMAIAVHVEGWCLHPADRQRDDSAQSDTGWTCLDCGADSWGNTGPTGQKRHASAPAYTTSLDAIVELIERKLPGCGWAVGKRPSGGGWARTFMPTGLEVYVEAASPVISLCLSLLRALQHQGEAERG
ncbi:hypothetical protein [Phenylobacterium sp. 58.2.17]|uniref:hypothetical protein n=1 Tax=Phenylobacterium sp. 58.2.17 TaxID=2969306 RepID=UPI0022641DAC|nr:hypothetical protein [Phenylobacterium sp. 58.2.17]MCX7585065.1 hypothetical protein [Phenylobacterium sp. 58.2.17]